MYQWYKIFNANNFIATGLVSRKYSLILAERGMKDFLVTFGVALGVTYEGVFLSVKMNDLNPFKFEQNAVYMDDATSDVYFGYLIDEN